MRTRKRAAWELLQMTNDHWQETKKQKAIP